MSLRQPRRDRILDDPAGIVNAGSGDDTVLELRARFFTNAGPGDTGFAIANDDYLQLQLSRYF